MAKRCGGGDGDCGGGQPAAAWWFGAEKSNRKTRHRSVVRANKTDRIPSCPVRSYPLTVDNVRRGYPGTPFAQRLNGKNRFTPVIPVYINLSFSTAACV